MAAIALRDELINDSSNGNPFAGIQGSHSLKDRLKSRLSRMLGRAVDVSEARDSQSIDIYVAPGRSAVSSTTMDGDRIQRFTGDLQDTMRSIAWCSTEGPHKEEISQDQWDIILVYVSPSIHDTIVRLQATFDSYVKKFDATITQTCGLNDVDEFGSTVDTELGDSIIRLQQLVNSYGATIKQQNELVELAWSLLQRPATDVRLRCLLGSTISNKLYDLICKLSHPLSTHYTLVRVASTFLVFRTVNIHLRSPPPPPPPALKAICSPLRSFTPPQQPQSLQQCRLSPLPRVITPPQGTMMETIRRYLHEEDRGLGLLRLQPASKQAAALLIGCVLHKIPVPPGSDTYYLFGFTTCRTEKEEGDLADYYQQLLKTSIEPTIVFASINKALEHGTLLGLLRNKAGQNMDKYFPALQQFLSAQPGRRFSVHKLVHFIRDEDNDEPPACLKRDFGFKFCTQREQVLKLKALYTQIIDKAGPGKLHYACTFGRLLDHAISTLGFVELSMRRLLHNDYPSPSVGYDNSQGLENYMIPLFRRSPRK